VASSIAAVPSNWGMASIAPPTKSRRGAAVYGTRAPVKSRELILEQLAKISRAPTRLYAKQYLRITPVKTSGKIQNRRLRG
jgi:hypothetical protein